MNQRIWFVSSQKIVHITVSLTIVNYKRHFKVKRKPDLFLKNTLLQVFRNVPMIIKTCFADCNNLFMFWKLCKLFKIIVRNIFEIFGMKSDCGIHKIIFFGIFNAGFCRFKVNRIVDNSAHTLCVNVFQKLKTVIVKPFVVIMRMRIKNVVVKWHRYISLKVWAVIDRPHWWIYMSVHIAFYTIKAVYSL